jgi:flavin-dependent dehydrogenase
LIPLPDRTDVFVVGGGPAGLAAAIAARRRGLDVVVVDQAIPPIDKACGEGVMPDGLAAARALGIELERAGGYPFRGIRFHQRDQYVNADFPEGRALGVRRTVLHPFLVAEAERAGVQLAWGVRTKAIGADGVLAGNQFVHARWIIGADGGRSMVRQWAGLDACRRESLRYGFRRHYAVAPWSEYMELHWGDRCQFYVTPIDSQAVCLALISRDPHLRMADALPLFPDLLKRLGDAPALTQERGAVSATRKLERVTAGQVALVGDASGSVDAITGEGLCLLFHEADALGGAMAAGDLALYERAHRRISRRPRFMSDLLLLLDRQRGIRRGVIHAMAAHPPIFQRMLALHVGVR